MSRMNHIERAQLDKITLAIDEKGRLLRSSVWSPSLRIAKVSLSIFSSLTQETEGRNVAALNPT